MYFTPEEIGLLESGLSLVPHSDRQLFFNTCLQLRRRERNQWEDTPLAMVFCPPEDWHLLQANAVLQRLVLASFMLTKS